MTTFVSVEEARTRSGLRLSVVGGVPSPWSEAAKGILRVKGLPYVAVRQAPGDRALEEWTGEQSAPVAMYDDEKPRSGWAEILLLAERLSPEPALIPRDASQRALCFGLAHEICGEMGLAWSRRLVGLHDGYETNGEKGFPVPVADYLAPKYGFRAGGGAEARRRVVEVLGLLANRLHAQRDAGSGYYLGDGLTAVDIYSATFLVMFSPLDERRCPMPEMLRTVFEQMDDTTREALDPVLLQHRDRIYEQYLELPVEL
jgi:glutathione S-transferase